MSPPKLSLLCALVSMVAMADGTASPVRYLVLGDSFSCGTGSSPDLAFPSQLKRLLSKKGIDLRVENVAVNGYSTTEIIDRELEALPRFKPEVVTLAVGANDLVRGDDEVKYRRNLKRIFKAIGEQKVPKVFVLPQPDWSHSPVGVAFGEPEAIHARIVRYNAILAEESKVAGATWLDLFPLFERQAREGLVAPDGLHPNPKAYAAWAEALAPHFTP